MKNKTTKMTGPEIPTGAQKKKFIPDRFKPPVSMEDLRSGNLPLQPPPSQIPYPLLERMREEMNADVTGEAEPYVEFTINGKAVTTSDAEPKMETAYPHPQVQFQKLYPDVEIPQYKTDGAAGFDLKVYFAMESLREANAGKVLAPGVRALFKTGLSIAIPPGYEGQIRPRSGLALKHGITVLNTPGTIDADYRGEIGVILINLGDIAVKIQHGMRIAQVVIAPVAKINLIEVEKLPPSSRGGGGFGHTGDF